MNACECRRSQGDSRQPIFPLKSSGPSPSSSQTSRPLIPPSLKSLPDLRALPILPFSMVRVRKPGNREVSEALEIRENDLRERSGRSGDQRGG
ncbi:hypothetical protein RCIA167 [Methanocella arvoryzae MRE50]|uniref:Uncharacterized protein n=1 Tax=Methanocella arvoryzae (strain DSM 22066 / NBRC 105507 / MRE50) TaxID=351160 RepID=Q0W2H1_METAR|nr:hypothetical protein RCIA167 [Methanocella arvoryzae MRE50]